MNFNVLNYVVTIYEEKSFTKAAEKLFISQPSLSQSINNLENELGTRLFDRKKGAISATASGELYVRWAKSVINSHNNLMRALAQDDHETLKELRVGMSIHRAKMVLPKVLEGFYAQIPGCKVIVDCNDYNSFSNWASQLSGESLDLVIAGAYDNVAEFDVSPLYSENIYVIAREDLLSEDILARGTITLDEFAQLPLLIHSKGNYLEQLLSNLIQESASTPNIVLETGTCTVLHTLASKGFGATLEALPRSVVPHQGALKYLTIQDRPIVRTINLYKTRSHQLSHMEQLFVNLVKEATLSEFQ